jgi:hypothetical protein
MVPALASFDERDLLGPGEAAVLRFIPQNTTV